MKWKRKVIEISKCSPIGFHLEATVHPGDPEFLFCCYYRNGGRKTIPTSYKMGNEEEILFKDQAGTPEGYTLSARWTGHTSTLQMKSACFYGQKEQKEIPLDNMNKKLTRMVYNAIAEGDISNELLLVAVTLKKSIILPK